MRKIAIILLLIFIALCGDAVAQHNVRIGGYVLTIAPSEVDGATHTINSKDQLLHVTYTDTGAVTITLASLEARAGRILLIKDAAGGAATYNITVVTEGSETIDGDATITLTSDWSAVYLYSDGTDWFIY